MILGNQNSNLLIVSQIDNENSQSIFHFLTWMNGKPCHFKSWTLIPMTF